MYNKHKSEYNVNEVSIFNVPDIEKSKVIYSSQEHLKTLSILFIFSFSRCRKYVLHRLLHRSRFY